MADVPFLTTVEIGSFSQPSLIMFTSGTTTHSKGVVLCNYQIMHAVETYRRTLHIHAGDITVLATPMYHITGLVAILGVFLLVGGTIYIHRIFQAERVITEAEKYGFTFLHASPTVFHLLLEKGENKYPLKKLISLACGSGYMTIDKLKRIHNWLPESRFHTVYGLTETCSPATIFPTDAAVSLYIGSCGVPIPGIRMKIVDNNKVELPDGEIGEIAVSGITVLKCYYKQDVREFKDGWLYTGDLGYFNADRYLYILDRKKYMINRGGEKIWCYDVENELTAISEIEEAAVVGIPDELYGEVPAAVIRLTPNSTLTESEIQKILLTRMAKYKIPVRIQFVRYLPHTVNGKVDKAAIIQLLTERIGQE